MLLDDIRLLSDQQVTDLLYEIGLNLEAGRDLVAERLCDVLRCVPEIEMRLERIIRDSEDRRSAATQALEFIKGRRLDEPR